MFRSLGGFRARYHNLTLLVVHEFSEWKVLIHAPDMTIHGTRQFTEEKAKEHALVLAQNFIAEKSHEDLPLLPSVEWGPANHDDWLVFHA